MASDRWTEPFWDAAEEHRLTCARCGACGHFRMPPTPFCPVCRSQSIEWPTLPGTGTLYSYTIVERATLPGTEHTIPYVPAVVTLDGADGRRMVTNIVDSAIDAVRIGAPVHVVFDTLEDGTVIPRFRLGESAA
nr:Zn-ribbon domain-containing OB-fold protein [Sphingomonas sp. BT552]